MRARARSSAWSSRETFSRRGHDAMLIDLTEEQALLRDTCRQFAARELTPNAKRWDREHRFPAEALKKCAELGLLGVDIPAEEGGAGMATICSPLGIAELTRG